MPSRPPVFVHLLPALIPAGVLRGGVAVVIDILRATTTMVHALAAGCDAIIPCVEIDEARAIASKLPEGSAVLAGERQGLPIDGFDLGNSPGDYTPELCSGKTVVMTTTNGTKAIHASLEADRVLIAAFVNRSATVELLKKLGKPIHLVCAGTDGQISLEDTLFAGAIAQEMDAWAWEKIDVKALKHSSEGSYEAEVSVLANDQAEIAASNWRETELIMEEGYELIDALGDGRGGRRVIELGLEADLDDAAAIDRFPFAVELLLEPFRIVPAKEGAGPRLRVFG